MDTKAVELLLEAAAVDRKDTPLRFVLTIREEMEETPPPDPAKFASRVEYRRALIDQKTASSAASGTEELAERFSQMGLKAIPGLLSQTIVVEGSAEALSKALANDAVTNAYPDDEIELIRPRRSKE